MSEILDRWPVGCDNSEEYVLRREGSGAPHYVKHWSDGMWGVEGPSLSCVAKRHAELLSEIARLRAELEAARGAIRKYESAKKGLRPVWTAEDAAVIRSACEVKR